MQQGNPCNVLTGAKLQTVQDYVAPSSPLGLTRHYTSMPALPAAELGLGWRHTYMRSLQVDATVGIARLARPNGDNYRFVRDATGQWQPDADVPYTLQAVIEGGVTVGWLASDDDDAREHYAADGRLIRIEARNGNQVELTYDGTLLQSVVDRHGRALVFVYTDERLTAVSLPDGTLIGYDYDTTGKLASVAYQADAASNTFTTTQYRYEDPKWPMVLTGIDRAGERYASWTYDASTGWATSSVHGDPAGNIDRTIIAYGPNGATVTQPSGDQVDYARLIQHGRAKVAAANRLCAGCGTEARTYDANGYPDLVTDYAGNTTDYDYTARGLIAQQIEAQGTPAQRTTQTSWHPDFHVPVERRLYDAANTLVAKTAWTYNTRGQALTATRNDPTTGATRTTTTRYCEQVDIDAGTCPLPGLVVSVDGPRTDVADVTTFSYYTTDDASCASSSTTCPHRKGDLWKVTNALGHVTEILAYDGAGRMLSRKDANRVITDFEYDPRGRLVTRKVRGADNATETDDAISRIAYTPTGLVSRITDPDGVVTRYEYDHAHRLTAIEDGEGNRIEYTLDDAGNRIREDTTDSSGALLRTLSRVYDALGQMETIADAEANPTDFTYDAAGNVDTMTDAYGRVTDHDYDPLGRLRRTLQDVAGIGADTSFGYDAQDRLVRVTDPKGLDTVYDYNAFGDLIRLASPDTEITTYTYDNAGNRLTATDARGETATYSYDALDRLVSIGYSDPSLNVTYAYDVAPTACGSDDGFATGRLGRMTDGSGSTEYCHDRQGRLVRKIQATNGLTFVTQYTHTLAGRLASMTYPGGIRVEYARNALGQANGATVTTATGIHPLLTDVVWYPFGPAAELTYGDGRRLQRSLNRNYQPGFIEDTAPGGLSLGYGFDAVGNLQVLRTGDQSEPPLRAYGYDALNRLTGVSDGATGSQLQEYVYDATGNRTGSTAGGVASVYAYPPDSHRLVQVDAVPRAYDAAGNTTAIGPRTFVYTAANRMGQVLRDGVVVGEYRYSGRGEQVWRQARVGVDCTGPDRNREACQGQKSGATANGTTSCEGLRGRERGECERGRHQPDNPGPPGGVTVQATTFVYGESGQLLGQYDETGAALQEIIWLGDLPVGLITGSGTESKLFHIQADHLGTPRVVIDPARQQAVWTWPLTGEAFGNDAPNGDPDGDGADFVFDLRFPGQRFDAASGLNYNYFRDYESATARYVQSDPIGQNGGSATYLYSAANALTTTDIFGLMPSLNEGAVTGHRVLGWVSCSRGTLKPVVVERVVRNLYGDCPAPISECVRAHEQSHIDDARRLHPSTCTEKFWEPAYWRVRHLANSGWGHTATEFGAHASQLRCLVSKLRQLGECDNKCRRTILRAMRDVSRNIRSVSDGSYGAF